MHNQRLDCCSVFGFNQWTIYFCLCVHFLGIWNFLYSVSGFDSWLSHLSCFANPSNNVISQSWEHLFRFCWLKIFAAFGSVGLCCVVFFFFNFGNIESNLAYWWVRNSLAMKNPTNIWGVFWAVKPRKIRQLSYRKLFKNLCFIYFNILLIYHSLNNPVNLLLTR